MRFLIKVAAAVAALCAAVASATAADDYPTRPIRLIVPYPPGGSTDPTGRAFGDWFSQHLGQSVVVDNRGGAGSTLGHALGAHASPDGYTILLGTSGGLVVSPAFGTKVSYDAVKDFAPIGLGVYSPFLIALHPGVPADTLKQLIDLSKAKPNTINFASPGVGTPNHLGMELMNLLAGTKFVHVPYKGGGPAMLDLISGRVQAIFAGLPQALPQLKNQRIKVVAVGHPTRVSALPDVPAIAETVPGFNNTTWYGILAPAGTPKPVIDKLNEQMREALRTPSFLKRLTNLGLEPAYSTPEEFAAMIRSEAVRWRDIMQKAGVKAK